MIQVWVDYINEPSSMEYIIVNKEGSKAEKITELVRQGRNWAENVIGTTAISLKDDGNGVSIKIEDKKIRLDYAELEAIAILLTYCHSTDFSIKESRDIITINRQP